MNSFVLVKERRSFVLAAVLIWSTVLSCLGANLDRRILVGHQPSIIAKLSSIGQVPATNQISLAIGLPLNHEIELDELLQQLYDPASTNFHRFLSPAEFAARFGPTENDYRAVKKFAEAHGFTVVGTYSNRTVLDIQGSAANVEQAFQIKLNKYHHPTEARVFFAPDTDPSVPTNVPVNDMWGLSDFSRPTPLAHPRPLANLSPLNYNGTGPGNSYQGRDFRNAYVPGASLAGSGQIAAVAEFDGYYANDISNYEANCGYTNVPLTNVLINVSGTPGYSTQPNAVVEVSLDIELLIAMAPALSRLTVYEGSNPYDVFSRIVSDNTAHQISCSWSWGAGPTHTWAGRNSTLDSLLKQMVTQGQSFFQSSGDSDAYTGNEAITGNSGPIPVDSIYVTSVGGTSLNMSGSGAAWSSETVWNWGSNEGSGGGITPNYAIPSWQTNVSMSANGGSTSYRNFPDVALTADAIEVIYNNGSSGIYGGTSCAAPLWAGFTALVNQQAAAAGASPVGFLNPALYAIAASTNYSTCFHDITVGNNVGTNTAGLYNAEVNYDLATGLGTPNGTNLINALAPLGAPFFVTQPVNQTGTNNLNVAFSVNVSGQSPLAYRWLLNGASLSAATNISGLNSNKLTFAPVASDDAGNYSVVVTNNSGAITSSVATLTVVIPPAFTAEPASLSGVAGGNAAFNATVIGASPVVYQWRQNGTNLANGSDLSGATSNVLSLAAITTGAAGNYTLLATNIYGAATSSVATLTVYLPPAITNPPTSQTIQCGSNAFFTVAANGTAPIRYFWSLDGATILGATNTSLSLTNIHLPSHAVSVVVTNLYGSVTSSVPLTVNDTLPPMVTLAGANPLYVELGGAYSDPGGSANDLCAGPLPATPNGTINTGLIGTNTIIYTANDGNGNTGSATRTVIVRDTTPPTISWSFTNLVLSANSNCTAALPDVTGTNFILASDLSGTLTISQNPTNNTILPLGTNIVIISVADASGNTAYSTNHVFVQDQTPPLISLNGVNPCHVELGGVFLDPGVNASDTCSGIALLVTNGSVNVNVIGTNLLTYTTVDGSDNTNTITRTVIVRDTTPPSILWSFTNLILTADSNCSASLPDVTGTNFIRATDLSAPLTLVQNPTNAATLPLGTNIVIISVSDPSGNTAFSTNQIIVQDQSPPIISLNGPNPAYVELGTPFLDPGIIASDACSGIAWLTTNGMVNVDAIGANLLTYFAVDGSGNTNVATRNVIVRDTTPPTILWSFTNLLLAAGSNCSAIMPDVTGTNFVLATDLSGTTILTQTPTNNTPLPIGTNVVIICVADASGNQACSTNWVIVQDQTPPVISLNGPNPFYVELGGVFADPGITASDECSGISSLTTNGSVNINLVGTNLLTYTAIDGSGNTNIVSCTVIVRDTTPPTVAWSFTNLILAANANCSAIMPDVTGTNSILATDLSGAVIVTQTPTNNTILNLGSNTVILSIADASGNTAYSTNHIVVQDEMPPVILAEPQSQVIVPGGTASFTVAASACTPVSFQWYFGTISLVAQTNASLTVSNVSFTSAGNYSAIATAAGGSTGSTAATLSLDKTTVVALNASENPSGFKDPIHFAASLQPTNATGTIQFLTNGAAFDSEPLLAAVATSTALPGLPRGSNLITAIYSGDANFLPATNSFVQTVTNHPPAALPAYFTLAAGMNLTIPVASLATNWSDVDGDTLFLAAIAPSTNGVVVTNRLPALFYSNSNYVNDQFVCTVCDGFGGTNFQTVNILILPQTNSAPIISQVALNPTVGIALSLKGGFASTYILLFTTNLASGPWQPIATNTLDATGIWRFVDTQSTNSPQRFYRLQLAP